MKKLLGTALIASLLAATGATAQDIRPLESTASSQAQTVVLFGSAIPTGFVVVGTVLIAGVLYAVIEESAATATSGT